MDREIERTQKERKKMEKKLSIFTSLTFDTDIYGHNSDHKFEGYTTSIPVNEDDDYVEPQFAMKIVSYTAPKSILEKIARTEEDDDSSSSVTRFRKSQRIIDREDDYRKRRLQRRLSPDRIDAFALGDKTPDEGKSSFADVMREIMLRKEEEEMLREVARKRKEEEEKKNANKGGSVRRMRNRWDDDGKRESVWDVHDSTPVVDRWDATPDPTPEISRWDGTPTKNKWWDGSPRSNNRVVHAHS